MVSQRKRSGVFEFCIAWILVVGCGKAVLNPDDAGPTRPPGAPSFGACQRDGDCVFAPVQTDRSGCCYTGARGQSRAYYEFMLGYRAQRCSDVCWDERVHPRARRVVVAPARCVEERCQ